MAAVNSSPFQTSAAEIQRPDIISASANCIDAARPHLRSILKVSGHAASCRTTTGTVSLACESAALRLELVKWPLP